MTVGRLIAMASAAALLSAGAASALTVSDCRRVTHPSYGGEAAHRDLGDTWVFYAQWWSQEGVGEWLILEDCTTGEALRTATRSENMTRDIPFDRTDRALAIIDRMVESPFTRDFGRIAERLEDIRLDPERLTLATESCACATLYPETRGDRPAFEMETL